MIDKIIHGVGEKARAVECEEVRIWQTFGNASQQERLFREARIAGHAIRFEGQPVRADITMLENVNAAAIFECDVDCLAMHRPSIAQHQEIGDPARCQQLCQKGWPLPRTSLEPDRLSEIPENPVAKTKADMLYFEPGLFNPVCDAPQEWRGGALEEEELALAGRHSERGRVFKFVQTRAPRLAAGSGLGAFRRSRESRGVRH